MINQFKTILMLASLTALLLFVGSLFGTSGLILAAVIVGLMNVVSYFFSHKIVLAMYGAKEAKQSEYSSLYRIVKDVAQKAGLPMPKVYIIPTNSPNAFATGRNPEHAVVAVTEGIMKILNEKELKGVIAHEFAHIKNRDILISTVAGTIAGIISYLTILTPIIASLIQLAISRSREYLADESGAEYVHDGHSLADALEKIEKNVNVNPMKFGNQATAHLFISNPFRNRNFLSMFMTHPPTSERARRLRSMKV